MHWVFFLGPGLGHCKVVAHVVIPMDRMYNGHNEYHCFRIAYALDRSCVPTVGQWVTSGVPRLSSGKKEAWLSKLAGRRCGSGVCLLAAQSAPLPLSLHRRPRHNFLTYGVCWRRDRGSHPQRRVPTCTCLVRTGQE